jgi:hypothetical protein
VLGEIVFNTTNIVLLSNTNVGVELGHRREGVLPNLLNLRFNALFDYFFDLLGFVVSSELMVD